MKVQAENPLKIAEIEEVYRLRSIHSTRVIMVSKCT